MKKKEEAYQTLLEANSDLLRNESEKAFEVIVREVPSKIAVIVPKTLSGVVAQKKEDPMEIERVIDGPGLEKFYGMSTRQYEFFNEIISLTNK